MARYIDADALKQRIMNNWYTATEISDEIDAEPTADVVEVVRCKDCKYSDENWRRVSVTWLPCMDVQTGSNWYCGSAERKETTL